MSLPSLRLLITVLGGCLIAGPARPAAGSASVGQTVALSVTAEGSVPFAYQWYKDGTSIAGATAKTYVLISVQAANAGSYHAVVSNSAGQALSDEAVLTVTAASNPPAPAAQSGSQSVALGDGVTFAVAPSGSSYRWQRQPAGSSAWQDLQDGGIYSGSTTPALTISSASTAMSGDEFRCIISGPAGSMTSKAVTLTVGSPSFQLEYPAGIAHDSAGNQ